jgi:hypothetical protein
MRLITLRSLTQPLPINLVGPIFLVWAPSVILSDVPNSHSIFRFVELVNYKVPLTRTLIPYSHLAFCCLSIADTSLHSFNSCFHPVPFTSKLFTFTVFRLFPRIFYFFFVELFHAYTVFFPPWLTGPVLCRCWMKKCRFLKVSVWRIPWNKLLSNYQTTLQIKYFYISLHFSWKVSSLPIII